MKKRKYSYHFYHGCDQGTCPLHGYAEDLAVYEGVCVCHRNRPNGWICRLPKFLKKILGRHYKPAFDAQCEREIKSMSAHALRNEQKLKALEEAINETFRTHDLFIMQVDALDGAPLPIPCDNDYKDGFLDRFKNDYVSEIMRAYEQRLKNK